MKTKAEKIPKPLRGAAFMAFLRQCAATVEKWPKWVRGER